MLKRKKKTETQSTIPLSIKLLIGAFILYVAFNFYDRTENNQYVNVAADGTPILPGSAVTVAGKSVAFSSRRGQHGTLIRGNIPGTGSSALCGETAEIERAVFLPENLKTLAPDELPDAIKEQSKTLSTIVGKRDELEPWQPGIIGMQAGGAREILIPAGVVFDESTLDDYVVKPNEPVRFSVKLNQISPSQADGEMPFRAMDLIAGTGRTAYCGERVKVRLDIWSQEGTLLYSTLNDKDFQKSTEMIVGLSELFYGLDRGILGMQRGGKRSLTVPASFTKALAVAEKSSTLDTLRQKLAKLLPKNSVILVDVTLLSVENGQ